jgi:hypothetical protein
LAAIAPFAFVLVAVVEAAAELEVGQLRLAAVGPMDDVVHIAPFPRAVATVLLADLVAQDHRAAQGGAYRSRPPQIVARGGRCD